MKEASGELSMTVVVIVGAVALIGIVSYLVGNGGPVRGWVDNFFNKTANVDGDW